MKEPIWVIRFASKSTENCIVEARKLERHYPRAPEGIPALIILNPCSNFLGFAVIGFGGKELSVTFLGLYGYSKASERSLELLQGFFDLL